ncbi:hypothetical protein BDW66DRAFT_144558 [Aspergillus desertorum]
MSRCPSAETPHYRLRCLIVVNVSLVQQISLSCRLDQFLNQIQTRAGNRKWPAGRDGWIRRLNLFSPPCSRHVSSRLHWSIGSRGLPDRPAAGGDTDPPWIESID